MGGVSRQKAGHMSGFEKLNNLGSTALIFPLGM